MADRRIHDEPHALRGHGLKALAVDRAEDSSLVNGLPLAVRLPDLKFEWLALPSEVGRIGDREFESVEGRRLAEIKRGAGLPGGERAGRESREREGFERLIVFYLQYAVG